VARGDCATSRVAAYGRRKPVSRTETGTRVNARLHQALGAHRHAVLVIYRGASDVAAKGVMFVITVAAARQLSRDDFAIFALASTLGWLGSVAADFGIHVHLAREVSQRRHLASGLLRRWLPVRIATGVVALVASVVAAPSLGLDHRATVPVVLFTLSYAANGLSECLYYFFRGLERTDLESTFTLVQRGAAGLLALVALWLRPDITLLANALLLPAVLTLGAASWKAVSIARADETARGNVQAAAPSGPVPVDAERPRRQEFVTAVAPIGLGILLSALYFRIDVFLLERWSGPPAVALYNAVFRLVDALRLFPAAVLAVALPALCRASDVRTLVRLAAPLTAAACGAAVVLWLAAAWLVPAIYGAAYGDAVRPFRVLVAALPLMALNYALMHQLIGWHGQRAYAVICGAALGVNLLLNWRLIPLLGMTGAAWSTLWTELFLAMGCSVALSRMVPIHGLKEPAGPVQSSAGAV
jgi:O-antigen/teichoic acid export membrane protein